jgi:hypothetical protein
MIPKKCPNLERNRADCPCEYVDCPRLGFCCECLRYHHAQGEPTACEKETGIKLPPAVPGPSVAEEETEPRPFRLIHYADCAG